MGHSADAGGHLPIEDNHPAVVASILVHHGPAERGHIHTFPQVAVTRLF